MCTCKILKKKKNISYSDATENPALSNPKKKFKPKRVLQRRSQYRTHRMEESIKESNNKKEKNTSTRFNLRNRKWSCPVSPKLYIAETLFIKSPKTCKEDRKTSSAGPRCATVGVVGLRPTPKSRTYCKRTDPCRPEISKKDYMARTQTWYIEQVAGPSGMVDGTHGERPCERIRDSFSRGAS